MREEDFNYYVGTLNADNSIEWVTGLDRPSRTVLFATGRRAYLFERDTAQDMCNVLAYEGKIPVLAGMLYDLPKPCNARPKVRVCGNCKKFSTCKESFCDGLSSDIKLDGTPCYDWTYNTRLCSSEFSMDDEQLAALDKMGAVDLNADTTAQEVKKAAPSPAEQYASRAKITKGKLLAMLKDLSNDAEISFFCNSLEADGGKMATNVYIDDVVPYKVNGASSATIVLDY